jgi:hypothetical protein
MTVPPSSHTALSIALRSWMYFSSQPSHKAISVTATNIVRIETRNQRRRLDGFAAMDAF